MLSLFPRDVLDEILDLIESVSEGFPTNLPAVVKAYIHKSKGFGSSVKQGCVLLLAKYLLLSSVYL